MPAALPGGPRRLNRATVCVLMIGAGISTAAQLARETGIHPATLSKLLRPDATQGPSWDTVEALLARFPLADIAHLVVRPEEQTDPAEYGLTAAELRTMLDTD